MIKPNRVIWVLGLLLVAAGGLAYWNSFHGAFLFDDRESILENSTIRHLSQWRLWIHPPAGGVTVSGRPGLNFSFAVNWAWTELRPWSYHLVNLAGHLCAGLLLFGLTRRTLLRLEAFRPAATGLAWATALLWVLHPLQTESVTYIVQRAEMLMGLCYLGTLYCFLRSAEAAEEGCSRPATGWAVGCLASCSLGMTFKEVMVSAPVIMLFYDRTFLSRGFRAAWRRSKVLWVMLALTWIPLILGVVSSHNRGGTAGFGVGLHPWQYWWTQGPAIIRYLKLTVWPHPLVLDYGFEKQWIQFPWRPLAANLAVGALALTALFSLRFAPAWGFLGFWFFSILAPTSLVPGNRQTLAEHRMYLALAPLFAAGIAALWLALRSRPGWWRPAIAALIVVAITFGFGVHARNRDYASEEGMWRLTVAEIPGNAYAHTNLGATLYLADKMPEAQAEFIRSAQLDPFYAAAESNLGMTYQAAGKFDSAIEHYRRALLIDPHYPQAANNLGVSLASSGHWAEAVQAYRRALALVPNYPDAEANLGVAERALGQFAEAETHLRRALALDPIRPQTFYDLGLALRGQNRLGEAEAAYARSLQLMPTFALAQSNWAVALALENKNSEAVSHFNSAIALDPANPEVFLNRGLALAALGQKQAAVSDYQTAVRLRPGYVDAWANLGVVQVGLSRPADAVISLKEAVRLAPSNARIHYDYSLALTAAGQSAAAAAEIAETLRLEPTMPEARNNLAVSLAAQGKLNQALEQLDEVVRLHPDFAPAHKNLALLFRALGRAGEARREAERAEQLQAAVPVR